MKSLIISSLEVNIEYIQLIISIDTVFEGLIQKERPHVKLHVTFMNTFFAKKIRNFDASGVIEKFSNCDFGVQEIKEIHLSDVGTKNESGYYKADGILQIS